MNLKAKSFDFYLYDSNGNLLLNESKSGIHQYKVDVVNLVSGLYFVKVKFDDEWIVKKIVIQH